jgi:hypothetical protein
MVPNIQFDTDRSGENITHENSVAFRRRAPPERPPLAGAPQKSSLARSGGQPSWLTCAGMGTNLWHTPRWRIGFLSGLKAGVSSDFLYEPVLMVGVQRSMSP